MDLFKRFPKVRLQVGEQVLIPREDRDQFPAFAADFAILDQELIPTFSKFDTQATRKQNSYRWMYVLLIFGGSLATILGIVQLTMDYEWLALTSGIVAAFLGIITLYARSFRYQERYLDNRAQAESLRTEYFLFLGHFGSYADENNRVMALIQRVSEIEIGKKNNGAA